PLEKLINEGMMPIEWVLLLVQAIVLGPILEELLFRGVLLGWLRRASLVGHGVLVAMILLLTMASTFRKEEENVVLVPGLLVFGLALAFLYAGVVLWVWLPVLQHGNRYFFSRAAPENRDED